MPSIQSTAGRSVALILALMLVLVTFQANAKRRKRQRRPAMNAPGTVTILSTSDGARVEIDGRDIGQVPLDDDIALTPGQHTIRVHMRGWTSHMDTFEIRPGAHLELEIDLLPIAGIVRVTTKQPGATVKINDRVMGVTPFDQDVPVGDAVLTVTRPGYQDEMRDLAITAGQTYEIDLDLLPIPTAAGDSATDGDGESGSRWWIWAAAALVAGGGTALTIALTSQNVDLRPADASICVCPPD